MFKYDENHYLEVLKDYIQTTYSQHYGGEVSYIDRIKSKGKLKDFSVLNAGKYLDRFGRKDGDNVVDLYKAVHYITMALHAIDVEKEDAAQVEDMKTHSNKDWRA